MSPEEIAALYFCDTGTAFTVHCRYADCSPDMRAALLLIAEGCSVEETADVLGLTEVEVRQLLLDALGLIL